MAYQERTDIKSQVSWPIIVFGDGLMGRVVSRTYDKDIDGKEITTLKIIPTPELIKKHNISYEEVDSNNGSITKSYPSLMLEILSHDPGWPVWFCYLDINARECESTQTFMGKIMIDRMNSLKEIIAQYKAENAFLKEQNEKLTTNVNRYIKENIVAPANEMSVQVFSGGMGGVVPTMPGQTKSVY